MTALLRVGLPLVMAPMEVTQILGDFCSDSVLQRCSASTASGTYGLLLKLHLKAADFEVVTYFRKRLRGGRKEPVVALQHSSP